MNKVRDVTSQVQEECDPRRQFVLAELSRKGQEEHRHQVTLLAWRERSHCLDDVQVPHRWSQVGVFSRGLSGTLTGRRQLRCDGSRGSGADNCLLLLPVHLLTPGQWRSKIGLEACKTPLPNDGIAARYSTTVPDSEPA